MTYIHEDRATELLTGEAEGFTPDDLGWLLATNVEAFLKKEDLTYARITEVLGTLEALRQEISQRVLRPFVDGMRGAGVDPLAESNEAAMEALRDFMRARVLEDLGITPPGGDPPAPDAPPLRFPPPEDEPPAAPPFPDADWVSDDDTKPPTP